MAGKDPYRIRSFVPDFDAISAEIAGAKPGACRAVADLVRQPLWRWRAGTDRHPACHPSLRAGAPIHMFVHGGYWRSGDKADYTCVAAPVLAVGGIAAIVEYDLMPGTRLATLVGQVRRAAAWLAAQATGLGADPARLTVSGHSAGAHLASYLAATGPFDPHRTVDPSGRVAASQRDLRPVGHPRQLSEGRGADDPGGGRGLVAPDRAAARRAKADRGAWGRRDSALP